MTNDKRKDFQVFRGKGKIDLVRVVTLERLELRFLAVTNPERKENSPPEKLSLGQRKPASSQKARGGSSRRKEG